MEERLSKNLTVGDLGGSECVREREVYPHGKDGVSEPGAYDISMADVEWIHWWSSDLTMDVEYCIWASSSEYVLGILSQVPRSAN